jgi:hypothetical protein
MSLIDVTRTELDHRSNECIDVTLVWVTGHGVDQTVVCVRDKRDDAYFEIVTEPYLALDVFHHPFAYRSVVGEIVDSLRAA